MLAIKFEGTGKPEVVRKDLTGYFDFCTAEIGCSIPEHVYPMRLPRPYAMIIDESGLIKNLPVNSIGSLLYGTDQHGAPICGPALILKDVITCDGPTTVSLDESDIPKVKAVLDTVIAAFS